LTNHSPPYTSTGVRLRLRRELSRTFKPKSQLPGGETWDALKALFNMRTLIIIFFIILVISCKKENDELVTPCMAQVYLTCAIFFLQFVTAKYRSRCSMNLITKGMKLETSRNRGTSHRLAPFEWR
jgi:hypothetical protein